MEKGCAVFDKLEIEKDQYLGIYGRRLAVLEDYINFLGHDPSDVILINTLTAGFGGDKVFTSLLWQAWEKSSLTKAKAKELMDKQLTTWKANKKSVDELAESLELKKHGLRAFSSKLTDTLVAYAKLVYPDDIAKAKLIALPPSSTINRNVRHTSVKQKLDDFTARIYGFGGDREYALLVWKAMNNPETSAKSVAYEIALYNNWLNRGVNSDKAIEIFAGVEEMKPILERIQMWSEGSNPQPLIQA